MKLTIVMMTSLLLASCASVGDFDDLAEPLCLESRESAKWLLENGERTFVQSVNVHNRLLGGC
jgi:hypothetical protein